MNKRQRIRWEIAQANRNRSAVTTGAHREGISAAMDKIENKYELSSDGIGGVHALAAFVSGGDYWKTIDLPDGTVLDGVKVGEIEYATNAGP